MSQFPSLPLGVDDTAPFRVDSTGGGTFFSAEHFAGFDGLQHGPQVIALGLGEFDVLIQRLAVQAFTLGDHQGALGEGFGEIAPG
jgi:hypothetical protein